MQPIKKIVIKPHMEEMLRQHIRKMENRPKNTHAKNK